MWWKPSSWEVIRFFVTLMIKFCSKQFVLRELHRIILIFISNPILFRHPRSRRSAVPSITTNNVDLCITTNNKKNRVPIEFVNYKIIEKEFETSHTSEVKILTFLKLIFKKSLKSYLYFYFIFIELEFYFNFF